MRERVREIFSQLPPEGIAIHGTNLARAKCIKQEGFVAKKGPVSDDGHFYFAVHPTDIPTNNLRQFLRAIRFVYLRYGTSYAFDATHTTYALKDYPVESRTPALIVFKPIIERPPRNLSFVRKEPKDIPADHIIGVIPLELEGNNTKKTFRSILQLLEEKQVMHFSKPQSLPEV